MRAAAAVSVLVLFCSCDREARQAENQRLDRCKLTLPILRSEPEQPYRVIQLVEAYSETDLAWYACVEHADAVISTFTQDEVTKTTVGGGPYLVTGRSRTTAEAKFIGRAIKYELISSPPTRQPHSSQPYESPPTRE
jgi:hypothetical protein